VTPFAELKRRLGATVNICVHRGELLEQLAGLVDPQRIHCGARCVGFDQDDAGVKVRFADGREERGDLVVGADGLHSVVRALLHGESKPRYAGYTCWRGLARFAHKALPTDLAFEVWGPGKRFSIHHCGHGRIFWYGTKNTLEGTADAPDGRKAEALQCFRNWMSPIPEVIEATEEGILRNDIVDRRPINSWGRGRVTLRPRPTSAKAPARRLRMPSNWPITLAREARCPPSCVGTNPGAFQGQPPLQNSRCAWVSWVSWKTLWLAR